MRYAQLIILVTLAAFAVSSTVAAVCIALSWPRLASTVADLASVPRARLIFLLRVAPALVGLFAGGMTVLAFVRHEPRSTAEIPGWILLTAAAVGAALFFSGVWRVIVRCWSTYGFLRTVERTATPVDVPTAGLPMWQLDTAFPLVALAGIWRPRLLIARCVLEQVPADELQVVLRHELAHARQHDNVARLLLTGLPDVLTLAERRLGIERAWSEAAEDAADDLATGDDAAARVSLASALVRVAKMVGRQSAPKVPLLAFHRGESVERRVRRLVDVAAPRSHAPSPLVRFTTVPLVVGALLLLSPTALLLVHHALEWLVNARP
jgi:Zn-dependent protease with chaperone function